MDINEAKERLASYLSKFGIDLEPAEAEGTWLLTRTGNHVGKSTRVQLFMSDSILDRFSRVHDGDIELLGVLIDEKLSADGSDPAWIAVKRSFPTGVRVVDGN